MSKIVVSVVGLLLLVVGFGLGYTVGLDSGSPADPPWPRTAEERARAAELRGELRGILMEPNVIERAALLSERLTEMGPEDVPAVVTLLEAGAVGLGAPEAALLTRFWALYEPESAARWSLTKVVPVGLRPTVGEAALEAWATADPERARGMMETMVARMAGPAADSAQSAFIRGWVASGEPGVEDYIYHQGPDISQIRNLTTLVKERLLRDGIEPTLAWLRDFPDDEVRFKRAIFRAAAPALVQADLETALEWCDEHCEKPYAEHVRAMIARQWAQEDGPAAMEWVSRAPAGDERDRAVWTAFAEWRRVDPDGLLAWVDEMGLEGVEPWFYAAVDRVAMWKSWEAPLEAYEWAALIPDEERRELAMISITRRYREVDEAGAEAWLEQSPLSEEARQEARTYPDKYKRRGTGRLQEELEPS